MRGRKRWVGVAALCMAVVVPEAHAQIAAAPPLPATLPAAAPAVAPALAQAAVTRAARLQELTAQVSLAQTAAGAFARVARPARVQGPAQSVGTAFAAPSAAAALTRVARLEAVSAQVGVASTAARAFAGSLTPIAAAPASPASAASSAAGAVVIRQPARDYGSGYLGSYAGLNHRTSSARGFAAAAAAPNGCLIIGDSVAARTAPYLNAIAREDFGESCAYEVWNGRPAEGAVNALQRIAERHGLPRRVVMIAGANDIFNPPEFRAQVERAVAIVGPNRTLTWASVFVRRPLTGTAAADLENSRWLNILLSRVTSAHENLSVVNWYGFLAQRQRHLSTYLLDGVHPTVEGRQALAELVAAQW
ncbi:MAG: hypothetical protein IPI32_03990 [Austwickia sp.]|nr:hypothetical protein [Austwickia sp.]MBK8436790.1 hypothetical protein [Austwickia sp.]MBK9100419.1 hypothetical protein [Austwickia sp.]